MGGARLRPRDAAISITRDPGALLGRFGTPVRAPLGLVPGRAAIWDGRLVLETSAPGWSAACAGTGSDPTQPILVNRTEMATLEEAAGAGWVRAEWLIAARIDQLLPCSPYQFTRP